MYFFTPDTIVKANRNIKTLDTKVGGLLCIMHCLMENIEENISYEINGEELRKQLSIVFDKNPKDSFENAKSNYIIFAKDWISTFFDNYIKNKVDLLSCAVFFLRRYDFEKECTKEEVIDIFIKRFNLKKLKDCWFSDSSTFELDYNQCAVEENQAEFYAKMGYISNFESITFNDKLKNSATKLKAAGHVQTLYSASGIHECFLLFDEPHNKYYIINNSNQNCGSQDSDTDNIVSLQGIADDNLTIEELGAILQLMYNEAIGGKVAAIHMFGLKYGAVIKNNNYSIAEIIRIAGISDSYNVEVSKGISIYKVIKDNEYGICFYEEKDDARNVFSAKSVFDFKTIPGQANNKIFYGVPGCGKSYHIEYNILKRDKITKKYNPDEYAEENVIRTTFYQDYTNTDFVGQILPKIVKDRNGEKDTVEYIFNPGPFTLALIQAISNPSKKVALVVEEINRGNAPAIFGDIFQLLDRDENGISEYGIINVGIMEYLSNFVFEVNGEKKKYTFRDIKIPGNMYIYATMNTSDQNVYTLDTAFTRRWAKERIENEFGNNEIKDMLVPGMKDCSWGTFVDKVNIHIRNKIDELQVNEDKQLGCFFVKKADLLAMDETDEDKKKAKSFAYKVLEYLWDDVSKLDHTVIFNPTYKTFEDLVKDYLDKGDEVFNGEIFK